MSVENWGMLAKSAVDPETIEQAIARLILVHEEDEASHLGVGESLQSHKASEIIDHAARSIVYDKLAGAQIIYSTQFENSAVFTIVGTPIFQFPGFVLNAASGGFASRDEVYINAENLGLEFDFSKDMIFQFVIFAEVGANAEFRWNINAGSLVSTERNLGLSITDNEAHFYFARTDGTDKTTLDWASFAEATFYVVRIEYDASEGKAFFYINNVLLGSLTCPNTAAVDVLYIHFGAWNTTAGQTAIGISQFSFQLEP